MSTRLPWLWLCALATIFVVASALPAQDVKLTSDMLEGIAARSIGPAAMGGRIAAIDAVAVGDRLHVYVGSASGGVWKSTNAGITFQPVFDKHTQSIGALAIDHSDSNTIWVGTGEAKTRNSVSVGTGVYKSTNGGESWREMNATSQIQARPFYFATLVVDPRNHNRVYKPSYSLMISEDGGRTFSTVGAINTVTGPSLHSDHHALWIDPANTDHQIQGTDGGVYISYDRGAHWRMVGSLPVSQFYRVSFDMDRPYNVYGGLQDNGTWTGPSMRTGGISNRHWRPIGFGDGFWALVDPNDPDTV